MPSLSKEEWRVITAKQAAYHSGHDPTEYDFTDEDVQDRFLPEWYDEYERYFAWRERLAVSLLLAPVLGLVSVAGAVGFVVLVGGITMWTRKRFRDVKRSVIA